MNETMNVSGNQRLYEFEGTWEDAAQAARWTGRRVRLSLVDTAQEVSLPEPLSLSDEEKAQEQQSEVEKSAGIVIPQRPEPTPEQARLGIMPPAIGDGSMESIMKMVQALHAEDPGSDEAVDGLWAAIAESRAEQRKMAAERE